MDLDKWTEKRDTLLRYRYEYVTAKNYLAGGKKKNAKPHQDTMRRYQDLTESLIKDSPALRELFLGNSDNVGRLEKFDDLKKDSFFVYDIEKLIEAINEKIKEMTPIVDDSDSVS